MQRPINVLVIVNIGLLCLALVTPLLYRVRLTVNQARCASNMWLLCTGCHNYASTRGDNFPQATHYVGQKLPQERRFSSPVYRHLTSEQTWDAEAIRPILLERSPIFHCPSHPNWRTSNHECATHYIGIAGAGANAAELPKDDPAAGVFGYNRSIKLSNIKDGTSQTVMAAETTSKNGPWVAGGYPTVRGLDKDGPPYVGMDAQFGSRHFRTANVVFLDSSVRAISDSIDSRIFEAIVTVAGKEPVDLQELD